MKYYTLDDIMKLNPCHNREKLEEYMKGRKRISLSGILNSKASDGDKVWLVVRLLPKDEAAYFAKRCADSVSHLSNNYARNAAWTARDDAAYAAWHVIAAADAATAAAIAAACDIWDYGNADAYDEAYYRARKQQVNQLKLIVKEHNL